MGSIRKEMKRSTGMGSGTSFVIRKNENSNSSSTVSRVLYQMIIYLDCTLPCSSFVPCGTKRDIPESTTGRRIAFCFVLLRVGFTQPLTLPQERWSLTPPFHPYRQSRRFLFCCTGLRVAPTGRYPAPCPAEPGLSSPKRARSSVLLCFILAQKGTSVKGR